MSELFRQPRRLEPTEPPKTWKRRSPRRDWWAEVPMYFGALAWTVTLVAVMFASRAVPRRYGADRFFGMSRRMRVDTDLIEVAVVLLLVTLLLCGIGLAVSSSRTRRQADRYKRSLLTLAAFSVVGICACWWSLR
jgi:hypothetical protein